MNSKRPRRQSQATDNRIPVKVWILPAHLEKAEAICLRRNQSVSGLLAQLIRDGLAVLRLQKKPRRDRNPGGIGTRKEKPPTLAGGKIESGEGVVNPR